MNWQFQYPQYLWALAAVPLFLLFYLINILWRRRAKKRIGDPKLVKELLRNHSSLKSTIKFILVVLAFSIGCIVLANPRTPDETSASLRKGIDIMIALDVSNSMLADDIDPDRLDAAKRLLTRLIRSLPNDRVGLVVFAGNAYIQMPLTFDHGAAELQIAAATPSALRAQGTSISQALEKSDYAFGLDSKRFKAVVLVTDGETHDENALEVANDLKSRGVMVNTVGIGTPGGASITDSISGGVKTDLNGTTVVSKLNEPLLQQIAATTNGKYILLTNTATATDILVQQLGSIEKTAFADASMFDYTSYYFWFALPMLLLLVVDVFISDRKRKMA